MENQKTSFKGVIILFFTAVIWGVSFVAQSVGTESVETFTFIGIRTLLGSLVLMPVILIKDSIVFKKIKAEDRAAYLADKKKSDKKALIYGSILGLILCAATNFQQAAFYYSAAGKIAFLTACYMFLVPLVGLFFKKRVPLLTWICVICGLVGLYFLSFSTSGFGNVNKGDVLGLICALFFTAHILTIEKFSPQVDGLKLSCVQFFVAGTISLILMAIFEEPKWSSIKSAAIPLLYSGIMSCGFAYTMQIIGQKYCEATIAS
ncbi:MAG: DMT family transporter, partial [Treponemataceae bacterium]|nr:DMT family transporter [Treponemataceae bacterium]